MLSRKVFEEGMARLQQAFPECSPFELVCKIREITNQDPSVQKTATGFEFVVKNPQQETRGNNAEL